MPSDFADTFARVGWDSIEAEVRGHKDTIRRWINEYDEAAINAGLPKLCDLRRQYLFQHYAKNLGGKGIPGVKPGRARRYVLGRTLTAVKPHPAKG